MKKGIIPKIALSLLCASLAAFLIMFAGALWARNLNNSEKITVYIAYVALGVSFVCCGLVSKKTGVGVLGALISGGIYAIVLLGISLISAAGSEEAFMPVGAKLAIFFTGALISAAISLIPSSNGKNNDSMKKKSSAVNKYIEERNK